MGRLKKMKYLVLGIVPLVLWGCSDNSTRPKPPPPPRPIDLEVFNKTSPDSHKLPGNEVYDVFVDSQDRVWFSTDDGVAMKDGNQDVVSFSDFDGLPNRKTRVTREYHGRIWVGTWGGGLGIYDGTSWSQLTVNDGLVDGQVYDIATDDTSLWFATVNGLSQYIDDDSRPMRDRWIDHSPILGTNRVLTSIVLYDGSIARGPEVWLGTRIDGVVVLRLGELYGIKGVSSNVIFAVGENGATVFFDGTRWRRLTSGTLVFLRDVWAYSERNQAGYTVHRLYTVGNGGVVNYGELEMSQTSDRIRTQTWRRQTSGTANAFFGVWGSAANNVYAVGVEGTISQRSGGSWHLVQSHTSENLFGIWGTRPYNIFVVGARGTILHFNGSAWGPMNSTVSQNLEAVWGDSTTSTVYAAGRTGTIVKYDGSVWAPMITNTTDNFKGIWGTSETDVYAVTEQGGIYHYDGGASWTLAANPTTRQIRAIWGSSGSNIIAVGGVGTYLRYNGAAWNPMTSGTNRFLKVSRLSESQTGIPGSEANKVIYDQLTGLFWVGFGERGLASVDVDNKVWKHYSRVDGLVGDDVNDIDIDQDGDIWVGTTLGLGMRQASNGQFLTFIKSSGMPDARVRRVYVDGQNNKWLTFVDGGAALVKGY